MRYMNLIMGGSEMKIVTGMLICILLLVGCTDKDSENVLSTSTI